MNRSYKGLRALWNAGHRLVLLLFSLVLGSGVEGVMAQTQNEYTITIRMVDTRNSEYKTLDAVTTKAGDIEEAVNTALRKADVETHKREYITDLTIKGGSFEDIMQHLMDHKNDYINLRRVTIDNDHCDNPNFFGVPVADPRNPEGRPYFPPTIEEMTLKNCPQAFGMYLFSKMPKLRKLKLLKVKYLGYACISYCEKLVEVNIPQFDGVYKEGQYAGFIFHGCSSLKLFKLGLNLPQKLNNSIKPFGNISGEHYIFLVEENGDVPSWDATRYVNHYINDWRDENGYDRVWFGWTISTMLREIVEYPECKGGHIAIDPPTLPQGNWSEIIAKPEEGVYGRRNYRYVPNSLKYGEFKNHSTTFYSASY